MKEELIRNFPTFGHVIQSSADSSLSRFLSFEPKELPSMHQPNEHVLPSTFMMANLHSESSLSYQNNAPQIHSPSNLNEPSSPPRRYNCSVCSTSFRRREHFERHLRSHSKSRDFRCDICDKQFARR